MSFAFEKDFEDALIEKLTKLENQWSRNILNYCSEEDLIKNWADIIFKNNNTTDKLNGYPLTETEMKQIIGDIDGDSPFSINRKLNGKYVSIIRDNPRDTAHLGERVDLFIFDKDDIAAGNSTYQIARQPKFKISSDILGDRRGDLLLLINGMPLIHIELKRSGVPVDQACNQISKYMKHGAFTGIFSLIQIFVAMNPEETKYFANPGRDKPFNSDYYFHWADFNNKYINDWEDIASTLLSIPMAHKLIGYATIADGKDNLLKVMRSYQYHAASKIYTRVVGRTDWDFEDQKGGYVYHTTGSGKTMTSFKCAQLIKSTGKVDKIVFLMDRNELWKQTYDNYRNFSDSDDIEDTSNTEILSSKLSSDAKSQLIVTSIQKMSNITLAANYRPDKLEIIQKKKIVFIVDEAHRSTFGTMLRDIKLTFKTAMFFGFTGTPIKEVNSINGITTDGLFGECLHKYTITEGIRDKNVLGFKTSKIVTFDEADLKKQIALHKFCVEDESKLSDEQFAKFRALATRDMLEVEKDIDNSIYSNDITGPKHRQAVADSILKDWDMISFRGKFHYILATSSIREAIEYYKILKNNAQDLFVTAIFDPHTDNQTDDVFKDEAVEEILTDYNNHFDCKYTVGTYRHFKDDACARLSHLDPYKDIDRERADAINIVIVVNQLLTGFDSKWINTLYLDKVLEYEQFIQAASRTNRLFGVEKQYGIIKYCRKPYTMEKNALEALKLYAEQDYQSAFVPSLGTNITNMNNAFKNIEVIFAKNHIANFSRLPSEENDVRLFADLFNNINNSYYMSIPQLFSWSEKTYLTEDMGEVTVAFDELTYNTLRQRYSEIPRAVSSENLETYDLKAHLTEIAADEINKAFMELKFTEFLKDLSSGATEAEIEKILNELRENFAVLEENQQRIAEVILEDILSGSLKYEKGKTFVDYIELYSRNELLENIQKFSDAFGFDKNKLSRIMRFHLSESDLSKYGRFDNIMSSLDKVKAKETMERIENTTIKNHKVVIRAEEYLRKFILSGGFDIEKL